VIVEPVPTSPRSPIRRGLWLAGLVLPPLLLVAVVAAGVLGPSTPEPALAESSTRPVTSAAAGPADANDDGATSNADGRLSGAPAVYAGLAVLRPSEAAAKRATGARPGAVAVGGYLAVTGTGTLCLESTPDPPGEWCVRTAILLDAPWPRAGGDGSGGRTPHLHATIPIGVRLPEPGERADTSRGGGTGVDWSPPVPVVAIGRFQGDARCGGVDRRCDHGFVIERVAWSDGVDLGLVPRIEPTLEIRWRRANPFAVTVSDQDIPLLGVLAWPTTIPLLEPAAAAAVAGRPDGEPVWLLRMVGREIRGPQSRGPVVRWVLLDDRRLRVLAIGEPAAEIASTDARLPRAP
jgi:hypothetical protein